MLRTNLSYVLMGVWVGLVVSACSSVSSGNGDGSDTPGETPVPGPPGTNPVPASELNVEELRDLYKNVTESSPSTVDRLRADWLNGVLTQAEYLKQKICYVYDPSCLLEKYKPATGTARALGCGAAESGTFVAEMVALGDEETIAFWESQLEPENEASSDAAQKVIPKAEVTTSIAKLISTTKVTTNDGKYCFRVKRNDPYAKQLKLISDVWDFTAEGKKFQVFYQNNKEAHFIGATRVMDAFKDSTVVSTFKAITGGDPIPLDLDDPECNPDQAYRMFIVEGESMGDAAHGTWELTGTGRTYIDFRVEELGNCWGTGFVRDSRPCATQDQEQVNGNVAHEYFHASESAAFALPNDIYSIDPCADCLADWASDRMFPTSDTETAHFLWHLYYPHVPLGLNVPKGKPYGSSLYFLFLHDLGGDEAIKRYLTTIPTSGFVQALEEASTSTLIHDSFAEAFHEFAEASLNLKNLPVVHSFRRNHSDYQDFFLASAPALLPLPDYRIGVAVRKTEVTIAKLPTRSIRYFAMTSQSDSFNALNHSITIDGSDWVNQGGHLSAIAVKIDEQDPLKYTVLDRVNLSKKGEDTICFKKLNQEPEVVMLVTSNGTRKPVSGKITVESSPFCTPINFFAKWVRPGKGTEYTGTDEVTVRATLGYNPGPMQAGESLSAGPYATSVQYLTQPVTTPDTASLYRSLTRLHADDVTITPTVAKSITSGGCTATTNSTSQPPPLGPTDFFGLSVVTLAKAAGSQQSTYSMTTVFADPKFLTITLSKTCSGECGESCSGTEQYELTLPNVRGTYTSGAMLLTTADDEGAGDSPSSTWQVEFTEPLEVQQAPSTVGVWYLYGGEELLKRLGQVIIPFLFDVQ